ncbi:MAG: helix-turn-helix transcriptional regulator [Clostridiales bacterium]|nr:helix-turn-helix transcriptional regulator [Clostridiales bacterium]
MKKLYSLKSKSIKFTWLATYSILFLLPLIMSIAIFFKVDSALKKEINESNLFLLKQVQQYTDNLVEDIERVATNLAYNETAVNMSIKKGDLTSEERYKLFELQKQIKNTFYNSAIQDVYIYFKNLHIVVNNKNIMDAKDYFNMFAENNKLQADDWIDINNNKYSGQYMNLKGTNVNVTNSDRLLAYMISMPMTGNYSGDMNIVVIIDKSKFLNVAKDMEALSKSNFGIINSDNELILKTKEFSLTSEIDYKKMKDNSGVIYTPSRGGVTISYLTSKPKMWKYVSIMPVSEYWNRLEQYRKLVYAGIVLCIFSGTIVAYFLLKKNYEPVKQLIKSLEVYHQAKVTEGSNEYNIISEAINVFKDEKKETEKLRDFQNEILRKEYIGNLLRGAIEENPSKKAEQIGIKFEYGSFAVISFHIGDLSKEKNSAGKPESFKLVKFIIKYILENSVKNTGKVFTTEIENNPVCLLNIDGDEGELSIQCKKIALKIRNIINNHYRTDLSASLSSIYKDIKYTNRAFKETMELMEFIEQTGGESVLSYSELNIRNNPEYHYTLEEEQKLANAVKKGDYEKASDIIEYVINKNMNELMPDSKMIKLLKLNIIGTLINAVEDIGRLYDHGYLVYINEFEDLIQYKNIKYIKDEILSIIYEICKKIKEDRRREFQIGEKVIGFINENYKNENMNISSIAETFNMSPSYLSKLFKLQMGEGILDYINKLRVEEAKKLIKMEKCSMEVIAKMVGYSNVKTFTRAFTKIEGITPGKYKEV